MLRVNLQIALTDHSELKDALLRRCRINPADLLSFSIARRSLDVRPHQTPSWQYQLDLELRYEAHYLAKLKGASPVRPFAYRIPAPGSRRLASRPIVIGFGPAGMAAGLLLAKAGYHPLILERGLPIAQRRETVDRYWKGGALDPECNVQFGEGGAGAFSDGKLTTRVKDPRVHLVLRQLIAAGADPSIAYLNHPHIGTERLCRIVESLRAQIESLGGQVRFGACLSNLRTAGSAIAGITLSSGEELPCDALILAPGHSARDTFRMLAGHEVPLEAKPFAIGFRIEHPQSFIDELQYRSLTDHAGLPPAEYFLSHTAANGKGAYSFCMCPGGYVVPAESREATIVTNGMSYAARDGISANSALVAQVGREDFGNGTLAGVEYQEKIEAAAYVLGKGKAPIQSAASFAGIAGADPAIRPTYFRGSAPADLGCLFDQPVSAALRELLLHTEHIMPGFLSRGAWLTAPETRTSSPVRIVRDLGTFESSISGIYPCGEGAGYSGGIISSAIDGIRCAEKLIAAHALPSAY